MMLPVIEAAAIPHFPTTGRGDLVEHGFDKLFGVVRHRAYVGNGILGQSAPKLSHQHLPRPRYVVVATFRSFPNRLFTHRRGRAAGPRPSGPKRRKPKDQRHRLGRRGWRLLKHGQWPDALQCQRA